MDSTLTASVDVIVSPAGIPFTLVGEGPDGWSTFEGTGVSEGEQQSIAVAAQAALPHALAKYNPSIEWRVEFCTTPQDLVSTEHTIYCAYGAPDRIAPEATKTRIEFLLGGLESTDPDEYALIGIAMAKRIFEKWGGKLLPITDMLWEALDDRRFECDSGRKLAVEGLSLLGFDDARLRWTCSDGCQAFPSTDSHGGYGYNSDCTDVEEPFAYCPGALFLCTLTPTPHAEHIYVSPVPGKIYDSGNCPAHKFQSVLRFGGGTGGGGAVGSPAENFFKIEDLNGDWWYISVVPPNGPILGSISIGDELDKAGRYRMMKAAQDNGFAGQHWYDNTFPATDLP